MGTCETILAVAGGLLVALASFYLALVFLRWLAGRILARFSRDMDEEDRKWFPPGGGGKAA